MRIIHALITATLIAGGAIVMGANELDLFIRWFGFATFFLGLYGFSIADNKPLIIRS